MIGRQGLLDGRMNAVREVEQGAEEGRVQHAATRPEREIDALALTLSE